MAPPTMLMRCWSINNYFDCLLLRFWIEKQSTKLKYTTLGTDRNVFSNVFLSLVLNIQGNMRVVI